MKETYITPECELILFDSDDVITTSNLADSDGSVKLPEIDW